MSNVLHSRSVKMIFPCFDVKYNFQTDYRQHNSNNNRKRFFLLKLGSNQFLEFKIQSDPKENGLQLVFQPQKLLQYNIQPYLKPFVSIIPQVVPKKYFQIRPFNRYCNKNDFILIVYFYYYFFFFLASKALAVFAARTADMVRPISSTPLAKRFISRHLHKNRISDRSPQNYSKSIFVGRRSRRSLIDLVSSAKCLIYTYMYTVRPRTSTCMHTYAYINFG